ncbi:MAG TPA: maleylacetoacetate isomerase [Polyangiaceae bacterium]
MKLSSYWRSSSAWRVRIGLELKGIAHELVLVHLLRDGGEQNRPAFAEINPMGQVPVLEVDGPSGVFRLTQSMAILEYLEEVVPEPPLLPKNPELRARVRELAEIVNSGIQPLQNLRFLREVKALGADPLPATRAYIATGLAALERHAVESAGTHLVGDAVSLADVYLVPQLATSRRFGVDLEPYPTLLRVEKACAALPAFQRAHANAQPDFDPEAK